MHASGGRRAEARIRLGGSLALPLSGRIHRMCKRNPLQLNLQIDCAHWQIQFPLQPAMFRFSGGVHTADS
jgi:hypothetical protein